MPDPSISVTAPSPGATVGRPFTASGAYVSNSPFPSVSVVLKDSSGTVVATGSPVTVGNNQWSAPIAPTQAYTNASVYAELVGEGANDSVGNITVT